MPFAMTIPKQLIHGNKLHRNIYYKASTVAYLTDPHLKPYLYFKGGLSDITEVCGGKELKNILMWNFPGAFFMSDKTDYLKISQII